MQGTLQLLLAYYSQGMQPSNTNQSGSVYRSLDVPKGRGLVPLLRYSPEKGHIGAEEGLKLRSSASTQCHMPLYQISHSRKPSLNRSTSLHEPAAEETEFVPTRARQFNDMVNKKRNLLRIKHKIKGGDCIPNILEIRESVRKEEASFLRRINTKLNSNGNANLLINLQKEFKIKSQNYLREICLRNRKHSKNHRKQLNNVRPNTDNDDYITIQYLPLHNSQILIQ